ncbi:MAG: Bro-N domain-containing protein [Patescibacteria group bacterium]
MKKPQTKRNITPAIFEEKDVRRTWHHEQWYFSVIDVVAVLSGSERPRKYWDDLKRKLKDEGSQLSEKIGQLKLMSLDGKSYLTDVANLQSIFRIIQSIPSPKAEPFKQWLAKVGQERIDEMMNPELALNRSREYWKKHGRSDKWIQQRMMGQETRNKLTDYWKDAGVEEGKGYAILTNIIHHEWSDLGVQDHKKVKGLGKSTNLRDHMSEAELIFTALAELSTRQIAENMEAKGLEENKIPAKRGGKIAKDARVALEEKTGKKVVTGDNYLPPSKKKLI